jgi:uncharacterized protein (TIGR03905 family)
MHYTYKTHATCSAEISFDVNGEIVSNIRFIGGCDGNLKALPILLEGWTAKEIAEKLKGITCGRRPTSCADQLAAAVLEATAV